MKLGAYTACLHDRSIDETLKILGELGLTSAEINTGGFIGTPHIPIDDILASAGAREDYLGRFAQAGITLTGLNVNGNPLNPDPLVGPKHADDLRRTIEVAALLGVERVVTMSGLPGAHPGSTTANWVVNPWDSQFLDVLDYQWNEVAVPFWKDIQARAATADVKVCIEMHPQNLVFNPPTLQRLVEQTNATHVGAEMDPSHLFWQASTRWPRSSTWATWSSTRRRKTPGSTRRTYGCSACSTTVSPAPPPTATRSTWAATTRSTSGPTVRRGSSSRSGAGTATSSGCRSCVRCARSTPTWPSTSSTRTPNSTRSRACARPPST